MIRLRRALLAPLALVLLLPLAPAGAAAPAPGVSVRHDGTGSVWTAATFATDGERITSHLELRGAGSPVVLSSRVYVDGVPVSTSNTTVRATGGGRGVRVEAPSVAGVEVELDESEDDSGYRFGDVSVTLVVNPDGPVRRGRISVVLYAASGALDAWRWSLDAAAPARLLGEGTGSGAFLYTARDFPDSDLSVYGGHTVPDAASVYVRANSGARKTLRLDPRFLGSYTTFGADRLRVVGPSTDRTCAPSCEFESSRAATRVPVPGPYTFMLDGSSVGVTGGLLQRADTDVALHGALVQPPHAGRL